MKRKYLIILFLLATPAVLGLFHQGFFSSHDGDWMTIRLSAFHQSLRDGHFPVRWSQRLNHGYGYTVFNFVYPLPFYLGEIFYLLSSKLALSMKLIFIFSFFGSGFTMYSWLKHKLRYWPALAGALLYLYTPYRFVDTYVRGSVGESLAFVFVPLIFLAVDLLKTKPKLGIILGALSAAATLLSHNTFFIFLGIAFLYGVVTLPKEKLKLLLSMFTLGAAASAYFWLPAITELKFVYLSQIQVTNVFEHLLSLQQLVLPSWGYGPASPGSQQSLSFQIGLVNLSAVIFAIWLVVKQKKPKFQPIFFISTFLLAFFLLHRISTPIWQIVPGLSIIQFPWRLLSVTTFASATLAAIVANYFPKNFIALAIIGTAIILTFNYAKPKEYRLVPDSFFATNEDSTTIWKEYMPIWVKTPPSQRSPRRFEIISGEVAISKFEETNITKSFQAQASEAGVVKLASIYYPGWQVTVNNQPTAIRYAQNNGMIAFEVPRGTSQVKVELKETPLRKIANSLSTITLIGLLGFYFWEIISVKKVKQK